MIYLALILALALALSVACAAGLHFCFCMFVRAVNHYDNRRTAELQRIILECRQRAGAAGPDAERVERETVVTAASPEEEIWPEVIDV